MAEFFNKEVKKKKLDAFNCEMPLKRVRSNGVKLYCTQRMGGVLSALNRKDCLFTK